MKRIVALLLSVLLISVCVSAMGQVLSFGGNAAALRAHQSELDAIWNSVKAGSDAGFVSTGRAAQIQAIIAGEATPELGDPSQIIQDADTITITGGLHFIEVSEAIGILNLENDAVLINFRATIGTLTVKSNAEYYGLEGSYAQILNLVEDGHAYLYGAYGDLINATDRGEVSFFDRAYIQDVQLTGDAVGAVIGEAIISSGTIKENAQFFDPNARVASVVTNGNGTQTDTEVVPLGDEPTTPAQDTQGAEATPAASADSGSGSGKSSGKAKAQKPAVRYSPNGTPYSQNIMDWVFNSTPQYYGSGDEGICSCGCDCGNPCGDHNGSCCKNCTCVKVVIWDAPQP